MNKLVSIIIVNYNWKRWLKGCFDSIYSQSYKKFEIIFIDNDSIDDSIDYVKTNYPDIKIISSWWNLWFGVANNIWVKNSQWELILLLNNDTILPEYFLEKLVEYKNKIWLNIVWPKILDFDKKDIYLGRKLSIDCTWYLGWWKETFYIEWCALLISKSDYLKLWWFDEKYFMYSEDIDLCWRALLYWMKVGITNDVEFLHYWWWSSENTQFKNTKYVVPSFRRYEVEKNNLRMILKNYNGFNLLWTIPLYLFQSIWESLVYLFTWKFKIFSLIYKAIWWNIINLSDTIVQRNIIQNNRRIPDKKILWLMSRWLNKFKAFMIIWLPQFK